MSAIFSTLGGPVVAFSHIAARYWLGVFPHVCREIRHWREQAHRIPDASLRAIALETQRAEQGNLEGAAAFAVLAPRAHRASVVRALIAYQAIYDYVDALTEQPNADPTLNAQQLHLALRTALGSTAHHPAYYAHNPRSNDDGYLRALCEACRGALSALPSYGSVAVPALRAAERMSVYQGLNHDRAGSREALADWASGLTPPDTGLRWWETAAGSASSLGVFALIAAAAQPIVHIGEATSLERAYFPWIGALHVLLDSLIDQASDLTAGEHSLVAHYVSSKEAGDRLNAIAVHAMDSTKTLTNGTAHAVILAGMTSFYCSTSQAYSPSARPVAAGVLDAVGCAAWPAMLVHRLRRGMANHHVSDQPLS